MDRMDDLDVVDPTQVRRRDAEVCMPELALYDEQRDSLAGHLDSVGMPELMVVPTSAQGDLSPLFMSTTPPALTIAVVDMSTTAESRAGGTAQRELSAPERLPS
jgi:hypothetical protein